VNHLQQLKQAPRKQKTLPFTGADPAHQSELDRTNSKRITMRDGGVKYDLPKKDKKSL